MIGKATIVMSLLWAAALPLQGNGSLWAQWGLAGAVVAYTLWRDHHREHRMSKAINENHEWVRNTLVDVVQRNTTAMDRIVTHLEAYEES